MRNVIVLGAARSGTSLLMGTLSQAGYFMGGNLIPPDERNPKGFFETQEINRLNERLLDPVIARKPRNRFLRRLFPNRVAWTTAHLAHVPASIEIPSPSPAHNEKMRRLTQREPFCLKDPRFSYSLPVWRPFLRNTSRETVYICVFRHPSLMAKSMGNVSASADFHTAVGAWTCMYEHILLKHRLEGAWLFVNFEQMFSEDALEEIENFTGAHLDHSFPDRSLERSTSDRVPPKKAQVLYRHLCSLSGYEDPCLKTWP